MMGTMDQVDASFSEDDRHRLLTETITDYAIYILDTSGLVTSWNRGAQRMTGYDKQEVLGKHFSIFYTDQDQRDGLPNRALECSARDGTFQIECWRVSKDGRRFWAHTVLDSIRNEKNELEGFAQITRDLTERKRADEFLKRNDDQFKLLVQNVADYAIYMLDLEGTINSWNTGAQQIAGYLAHEVIGRHFSLFYTKEDQEKGAPAKSLEVAAQDGKFAQDGWLVRKDGAVFWASAVISPIRDDDGSIIGFAKVTRDLTHAKKAQRDLERARDTLFQSQKMEAIGQLTGGVAHDFNNILMAVIGGLEIVQRRMPTDPSTAALLENAIQSARRGTRLTQRMLAFARRQDLKPETIDLSAVVHGIKDLLQRSLGPSITIETRFPSDLNAVHVDPHQFELALLNLAMNSRDAMQDGGLITIAAREETIVSNASGIRNCGHYICLSVTDRGDRMDGNLVSRTTEPFFTTKEVGRVTALGLSMVHGFAEQSGGQFILSSREGDGTIAEIWLPAVAATAVAPAGTSEDAIRNRLERRTSEDRPLVVVAVDDDRLVLMDTTAMLNELGHRVFTATSGERALDLIRREALVDLVIIDHAMPDMSGAELAEAIRMEWPAMPLIFTTPLADRSVQKLAKPFRQEDLARAISRANPASTVPG
jgi:PAS domain S-box-containing protein